MKLELQQTVYNIPGHGTAHAGAQLEVEDELAGRMVAAKQAVAVEQPTAEKTRRRSKRDDSPTETTEGSGPSETA